LKIVVCGFRRIQALRSLGRSQVLARMIPERSYDALHGFEWSLWDNLSHRQLNPLEKARLLHKLRNICGVSSETLTKTYLPLLGLGPHDNVLESYVRLNGVHPALRRCLLEGRLTLSSMETLAAMPQATQSRMASLMSAIRLSASLQRKILNLLRELSAMAGARIDAPLDNPEMQSILADSRPSPFQKGERLYEVLYRMKNPGLTAALDRFQDRKKKLALPGSIRIIPQPFFETGDVRVEFQASGMESFRELAAALHEAAQSPELEGLFRVV
jgi:hypothetical protein